MSAIDAWHGSGKTVRIAGLDFLPMSHPILAETVQTIVKGQAAAYFLRQQPQGNTWLLKKFAPSRRPSDAYLAAVHACLPGGVEFFTCTQRRLLCTRHVDGRYSEYKSHELSAWLDGSILMPKVPGSPWCSITDSIREGDLTMTVEQRARRAGNLCECIERLEAGHCCHRDLSSTNVFLDEGGRIYLIDWDSLYHPSLSFQPNTTIGTAGYIAPFTRVATREWDARLSWRPRADRYGLAVLVAEILLTGPDHENPNEDGTLFSQSHLQGPRCGFVREQAEALCRLDIACGCLFLKALYASSFDACPSPGLWKAALHHFLRGRPSSRRATRQRNSASCGEALQPNAGMYAGLGRRGFHPLSKQCPVTREPLAKPLR